LNSTPPNESPAPAHRIGTFDAIAIIVGLIIGSGIFKLPQLVAMNSTSEPAFYGIWIAGGLISLMGALCYAELSTSYPHAGGDYHFLNRAFGRHLSFLFAWSRLAVVTSGPIAILGFVFGDYASNLLPLGAHSSALYATFAALGFTLINLIGIRETKGIQNLLTVLEVGGVVAIIVAGLFFAGLTPPETVASNAATASGGVAQAAATSTHAVSWGAAPLALLFVLFTFGGWNDGAYISAEVKDPRGMVRALVASLLVVTLLYLLVNYAYVHSLGLEGVARSETVAADVLRRAFGEAGSTFISIAVAISALTSINSTIIVGARSNYALGRDWHALRWLGHWDVRRDTPRNALLLQGVIALALIVGSEVTGKGFQSLIDYTLPVFWFFVMMVGVGLFILRRRDAGRPRTFSVPMYPLTPIVFIATCAFLLYSSLSYAGSGAWFGVGVVAAGAVLMLLSGARHATTAGDRAGRP
jgi:amino acid transporter